MHSVEDATCAGQVIGRFDACSSGQKVELRQLKVKTAAGNLYITRFNPAIEAPVSSQKVPAIIDDELDDELTMADPDPTTPFFLFVHAGYRRLGEVGHHVRRHTKGLARVVSIDTKRGGMRTTSCYRASLHGCLALRCLPSA